MIVKGARLGYVAAAWFFVAGVVFQIFLAGLSLFQSVANWPTHREFGYAIGWLILPLLGLAVLGRIPRAIGRLLALLLIVYVVQTLLPILRGGVPIIAALHPVMASIVLWSALVHARRALAILRETRQDAIVTQQVAASTRS